MLLKMINDLKEDSNLNEVRKAIQNFDKEVSNVDEKCSKNIEAPKKFEILEMSQ
jgi:hypothetical protein